MVRVNLAAFYRLAAFYGGDDLISTHISARAPDVDGHFLINPFGLTFGEINASSLLKVGADGKLVCDSPYGINYAGYVIHSAVHEARSDAHYVAHSHCPDRIAVASQKEGLLPLNQRSLGVIPRLSNPQYGGVALNLDERVRLVADLGDARMMLLRNHGTLALGNPPGQAWAAIWKQPALPK